MASLLDMIVRNRGGAAPGAGASPLSALLSAPRQGGGQQAPQPQQAPRRAPVNASDLLTPEDQQKIRQQQLLGAGLGLLSSDPGQGTLPRLAEGLATAQAAGQQREEDLVQRRIDLQKLAIDLRKEQRSNRMRAVRSRLFENADLSQPQVRTQLMSRLLQMGDFEAASKLNSFESNIQDKEIIEGSGKATVIDPRTLDKTEIEVPGLRGEGVTKINQGTKIGIMDNATGEVIDSVPVFPEPESASERLTRRNKTITDLASTWRSNTEDIRASLSQAEKALAAEEGDPAGQQTLVIALNKLLDPGSVVRQSEFARVEELGSLIDRAKVLQQQVVEEGQSMSPRIEQGIRQEIRRLRDVAEKEMQNENQFILRRANESGIDRPELIIPSRFRGFDTGENNPFLQNQNGGDSSNPFEGI